MSLHHSLLLSSHERTPAFQVKMSIQGPHEDENSPLLPVTSWSSQDMDERVAVRTEDVSTPEPAPPVKIQVVRSPSITCEVLCTIMCLV